jgi:replicative DNA helicase
MAKIDEEHEIYLHGMLESIRDEAAERKVLGTILTRKDSYYPHADQLFEELFFLKEHQYIYRAIKIVAAEGKVIDIVTVGSVIKEHKLQKESKSVTSEGGTQLISILVRLGDHANYFFEMDDHIAILNKVYQRRRIIEISSQMRRKCENHDQPDEIVNFVTSELVSLNQIGEKDFDHIAAVQQTMIEMTDESAKDFIKSGIRPLDDFIFGFQLSDQVIIGGAPSMGKTAFALRLFRNFISAGLCPAYFSLEMSKSQLISRMIASDGFIPLGAIRRKALSPNQKTTMMRVSSSIMENPFMIDDKTGSLEKILNKIRKYVIKYGTKVVIVDYLQLVSVHLGKGSNREQEIATISRAFKEIARDLGIVMIALSQLSRESSKNKRRPMLSDLRESGSIEQDADFVIFPFRPAYYETHEQKLPQKEDAELIIAKGRGTGIETVKVKFMAIFTKFLNNYNEEDAQQEIQQAQGDSDLDF